MLACQRTQQVHLLLTVNHPAGLQHASSSVSLGVTEHLYTKHKSASVSAALCATPTCARFFLFAVCKRSPLREVREWSSSDGTLYTLCTGRLVMDKMAEQR
ncbi:hypothetical protein Baya_6890 [Bagarius yarrelli]|uniref:Uncharacterized protein n=1 Tax=Bagarius yarrelli TaxID=175774 RepID=A0A556U370_BAGYA|nr:hypothetical protein Baya_6890 [Bagarius yarrelli]